MSTCFATAGDLAIFEKNQFFNNLIPRIMTGNEDHEIPLATASALTKKYRDANPPGVIIAHAFSKDSVAALLAQTNCVGVRAYYGLDANGVKQLVLVGVDASDNDLYNGVLLDRSKMCPPVCSVSNPLNS